MKTAWNPCFVAYAKVDGLTPNQVLERDYRRWPGGKMTGFMLWIAEQVRAFRKRRPECFIGHYISDQAAFTEFVRGNPIPSPK